MSTITYTIALVSFISLTLFTLFSAAARADSHAEVSVLKRLDLAIVVSAAVGVIASVIFVIVEHRQ